jgi:hypothetical protein
MAIVKARYTTKPQAAKATLRYITHRPDRAGQRQSRQLFDSLGSTGRWQGYGLIDQAKPTDRLYHLVISPDPATEDLKRDLHLRLLTEETLRSLSQHTGQVIRWVGVVHADHAPHRHIHVVAIVRTRLDRRALASLRECATQECQLQRRELDAARAQEAGRTAEEEALWEYS